MSNFYKAFVSAYSGHTVQRGGSQYIYKYYEYFDLIIVKIMRISKY